MKSIQFLGFLLILLITFQTQAQQSQVSNLQCEYLINPIGIDAIAPRLHWQMMDNRQGAMQSASQVIVGTDSVQVAAGTGNCWDTEKVSGSEMLVSYQGKALQPFTKYYWSVTLWDNDQQKSVPAAVASFET